MNENKSNEGISGVDSIRMGGMSINGLPIAESAQARSQWKNVQENEIQNEIEKIKGKYPKQTIDWVNGAIKNCESTITNIQKLIDEQQIMIGKYKGFISLCEFRDKELTKTNNPEKIKALKKDYPPYDVKAMNIQITLCNEAIGRSNIVIKKEYDSISELKELWRQCSQRDIELKQIE